MTPLGMLTFLLFVVSIISATSVIGAVIDRTARKLED